MRLIDSVFGWREIRGEGKATKYLTDYLLRNAVPAEIEEEGGTTAIRVGRADAKRILHEMRKKGIAAESGKLRGAPAVLLSFFRRPGIVCGVLCVFLLFLFARGRVWEIRVTGDGSVDEDEIRSVLFEAGLHPGMAIRDLSPDEVATKCLLRGDLFSGMNVSLSGVVVRVEWFGRGGDPSIRLASDEEGVNLVASCDAVIVSVQPTCGSAVVSPGQTVHKGDLLISGVTKGGAVRASGTVLAKVSGTFSSTTEKNAVRRKNGGRKTVSFSLLLFGEKVFSIGEVGDSASEKEIILPGGIVLPFSFRVGYAHETVEEIVALTEKETAEAAFRRLDWIIRESLAGGELLKKEVSGAFFDGGYTATAKTEYLINIAEPLAFIVRNEYNK